MNNTISVIIPTYNRSDMLLRAIHSVLRQTIKIHELIIVDDGSTDNTKEILERNNLLDKISYYYIDNSGPSKARNFGVSKSSGKWISFLDSDDTWDKCKLEKQMNYLKENNSYNICYTNELWIRYGKKVNQKKIHAKYSGWIFDKCLPLCIISPSSILLKREIFDHSGGFNETLPVCEDYDLWLKLSSKYPILFLDEKLITKYGGHQDQLSHSCVAIDIYRVFSLMNAIDKLELSVENKTKAINMLIYKCDILISGYIKHGKPEEADKYKAIKENYVKLINI